MKTREILEGGGHAPRSGDSHWRLKKEGTDSPQEPPKGAWPKPGLSPQRLLWSLRSPERGEDAFSVLLTHFPFRKEGQLVAVFVEFM